ncbi:MAG: DUF2207 domain-containing protein [Desulfosoma sp.]
MRQSRVVFLALITLFTWFPLHSRDLSAQSTSQERILDFFSDIIIHTDATLTVKETITVRALGESIKRGIVRDFPTTYKDRLGHRVKVSFDIVEIRRNGQTEPYHTQLVSNGVKIYIGSKDVFIPSGIHRYEITYRTSRELGHFKDFDELYWNVTGTGWTFPIDHAAARIQLPSGATPMQSAAYTGPQGAQGTDFRFINEGRGTVFFETTRPLDVGEGLTVAVAWPKGFVQEPTVTDRAMALLGDNRGAFFGWIGFVLVMSYYLAVWFRVGRDPKPGTIIPLFEPPKGFSPAAVRFVRRMDFDSKAFAAAVVNMAVKGHLQIREEDDAYVLVRKNTTTAGLSAGEKKIAETLFGMGNSGEIRLKNMHASKFKEALNQLHNTLSREYEKTYFLTNSKYMIPALIFTVPVVVLLIVYAPQPVVAAFLAFWLSIWSVGCAALAMQVFETWRRSRRGRLPHRIVGKFSALGITLFAVPFWVAEIVALGIFAYSVSFMGAVLLGALGGVHGLFYQLLKAPTHLGRKILDQIEGFRLYLTIAEKDRLGILHPPEKTPEHFEKYLPYALALDVEHEWCEQFADLFKTQREDTHAYQPRWYKGTDFTSFGSGRLAALGESLGSGLTSAIASASTPPGSRSGSGGGGSSGGGGGGGGGSGW